MLRFKLKISWRRKAASIITWLAVALLLPQMAQAIVPVADFTAAPQSGVAPLLVQFTDQSAGDVTSWSWDLNGDSVEDSVNQHPLITYTVPGSYSVTLTATGPDGFDSITKADLIVVDYPLPVADFTATPLSGVALLQVQFTDQSTGDVTSWSWDLDGDGQPESDLQNPAFTYAAAGGYTVSLTVTGPGGSDTTTAVGYITVTDPPPVAGFSAAPTSGTVPLTVNFTDQSNGLIDSWSWDLDNDGTPDSTEQNPSFTYTAAGAYTVSLTVTGPGGSDTITAVDNVSVVEPPPVAGFSAGPLAGIVPLTVSFTDLSSGPIDTWSWDFDNDGTPESTEQSPIFTYENAGSYTVRLTVTGPGGSDSFTLASPIDVNEPPPVAVFSATPVTGTVPLTVSFTDLSTGPIDSWSWDLDGDGQEDSAEQSPSFNYNNAGSYTIGLTVTGPGGSDSISQSGYVTVVDPPPVADFSVDTNEGLKPLTVHFTDLSTGPIDTWSWDLDGDGIEDTSQTNPAFTYERAGTYPIILTVTGPGGTDTVTRTGLVQVIEVITFEWDANQEEDLAGYYLYYKSGSIENLADYGENYDEFDGTGALEGDSPIRLALDDPRLETFDQDGRTQLRFQVTGLRTDQFYYFFAVTAFKDQDPAQESRLSDPVGTLAVTPPEEIAAYGDRYVNIEREQSYEVQGRGMPGETVEVVVGTAALTPSPVPILSDGSWSVQIDFSAVEGIEEGPLDLTAVSRGTNSVPVDIVYDVTAPALVGDPAAVLVKDTFAVIYWETDEPGTSTVEYGFGSAFDRLNDNVESTTRHYVMLYDLIPGDAEQYGPGSYQYRARTTDAAGNRVEVADLPVHSFDTIAAAPPKIVGFPFIDYDYVLITFDKPNLQGAGLESSYSFSPALAFDTPGIYGEFYDVTNFSGASYYLSMQSIPAYEVFTLTMSGITDSFGQPVQPATVIINDNDGDRIADDWEVDNGFNPQDPADGAAMADADFDGYSNYQEYVARTDPHSAADLPFGVLSMLPPDLTGVDTDRGILQDSSIAVLIDSKYGVDITAGGGQSIQFLVEFDTVSLTRSLNSIAFPGTVRAVNTSDDPDAAATRFWAVYDSAADDLIGNEFPLDQLVSTTVVVTDVRGNVMNPAAVLVRTETLAELDARNAAELPDFYIETVPDDPEGKFNEKIIASGGALDGTLMLYMNDGNPPLPSFGPMGVIPSLEGDFNDVQPANVPLNLQPSTVFNAPVRLVMPLAETTDFDNFYIYLYDGANWQPACDGQGNILPAGEGWIVPGTCIVNVGGNPPVVEMDLYHFSAVQGGVVVQFQAETQGGGVSGSGGCFVDTVRSHQGVAAAAVLAMIVFLVVVGIRRRTKGQISSR